MPDTATTEELRRFQLHLVGAGTGPVTINGNRRANLALARALLRVVPPLLDEPADAQSARPTPTFVCGHCGHAMVVLQVFLRDASIRAPPAS